jgi:hypothetical protein
MELRQALSLVFEYFSKVLMYHAYKLDVKRTLSIQILEVIHIVLEVLNSVINQLLHFAL